MNRISQLFLIGFLLVGIPEANSQELYMPYNIREAFENGTRSKDGKPGTEYFQNRSDYVIKAAFDPDTRILKGKEWITYYNNSPNQLDRIVMRLYQDFFKKGNLRDIQVDPTDINNGTTLVRIAVNDTAIDPGDRVAVTRSGTTLVIRPGFYINPGTSVKLFLQWDFQMPEFTTLRYGTYTSTSFMIAYWYPQVAVYDDIDGWDMIDFNGTQEFYNDFCNYKVEITIPGGYMVWATGNWENPADILPDDLFKKYKLAETSDEVIHIFSSKNDYNPLKKKKDDTFLFTSRGTTDFAFSVSNEYLWDAAGTDSGNSDERITIHAVYPKKSTDFKDVAVMGTKIVDRLAQNIFSYPFPYHQVTAFNGSEGMEFPMMINDGDRGSYTGALNVTSHELAHMYLPFLVGINEKKYAWMDEGMVTLLGKETEKLIDPEKFSGNYFLVVYRFFSGGEQEIPPMIPSNQLRGMAYQIQAYYRPASALYYLQKYLGTELFAKALTEFINRWKGKHPTPYDLFFTFNDVCQKNLNWFWNAWFFQPGWVDVSVSDAVYHDGKCRVSLNNEGGLPVPLHIDFIFDDGHRETAEVPTDIWKAGRFASTFTIELPSRPKEIVVDWNSIPDKNPGNNRFLLTKYFTP